MRRRSPGKGNTRTSLQNSKERVKDTKRSKESLKNSKERIKPVRNSGRGDTIRPPRIISKLLNMPTFLQTIRRSTDLATKLDWNLLNPEQQHAKILDLS